MPATASYRSGLLAESANATLNIIINRKVYVIELATDKQPFQAVTFYPADQPPVQPAGHPNSGPPQLLALLDKAKAYQLLADQYPEMVSQIDKAEPGISRLKLLLSIHVLYLGKILKRFRFTFSRFHVLTLCT